MAAERGTWSDTWRYVFGAAACLLLGGLAFVREAPVPLLSLVDLGIHELGHMLTYVFPDMVTAVGGAAFQVLVPVGLAAYFWLVGRDLVASGLCLAWAGTSAQQVAVYVADAPYQQLVLLGGEHDWAFILTRLGLMDRAAGLAAAVRWLGFLLLVSGIGSCLGGLVRAHRDRRATEVSPGPAWSAASR